MKRMIALMAAFILNACVSPPACNEVEITHYYDEVTDTVTDIPDYVECW